MSRNKLQIIAIPQHLEFSLDDTTQDCQDLKLINCLSTPVQFKISCNAVKKYAVSPAEFVLQPNKMACCQVRYLHPVLFEHTTTTDKLNIVMYDYPTRKVLSKSFIKLSVSFGAVLENVTKSDDESWSEEAPVVDSNVTSTSREWRLATNKMWCLLILLAVFGLLFLLPLRNGDEMTYSFASFNIDLKMSCNFKMICSCIIGCLGAILFIGFN